MAGDPAVAAEDWSALLQVVRFDEHRSRGPDLELVVVMKGADDGFTLRRVSLEGGDMGRSLPHLLDASAAGLRSLGESQPIQVKDQAFDRVDEALSAAEAEHPPADPRGWINAAEFRSWVLHNPETLRGAGPQPRDDGLGHVVGVLAGFAAFCAVVIGAVFVDERLGLNAPERRDTLPANVFMVVAFCLATAVALLVYRLVVRLIARIRRRRDLRSRRSDAPTPEPAIELPITLSLNPLQRACAVLIYVAALAGAWGAMHYIAAEVWDPLLGTIMCVWLMLFGIDYAVSSITVNEDTYTAVGAWRIETVPLSSLVEVHHRADVVELVALGGVVKVIGPLSDHGNNTLTHGLPPGATASGVATAIEAARRAAPERPPRATGRRLPPGYLLSGLAAGVLAVRALTLWVT